MKNSKNVSDIDKFLRESTGNMFNSLWYKKTSNSLYKEFFDEQEPVDANVIIAAEKYKQKSYFRLLEYLFTTKKIGDKCYFPGNIPENLRNSQNFFDDFSDYCSDNMKSLLVSCKDAEEQWFMIIEKSQ